MDRTGSTKDQIGYPVLLKGVMRAALEKAAGLDKLPGDHHFYITFRTRTPGVHMADYLKDRFPEDMTIVIQHQYWDFEVHDDRFEIILKFSGVPQHLRVPFAAVTRFFDPSVNFMLHFDGEQGVGAAQLPPIAVQDTQGSQTPAGDATVVSLDAFRRK